MGDEKRKRKPDNEEKEDDPGGDVERSKKYPGQVGGLGADDERVCLCIEGRQVVDNKAS